MAIEVDLAMIRNFHWYKSPLAMHDAYVEGNMETFLRLYQSIFLISLAMLKLSLLERIVLLKKFKLTPFFSKNITMSLLGVTMKC